MGERGGPRRRRARPRCRASTAVRALWTRKAHEKDINALDISPSSLLFASASQDRLVKISSTQEGEPQGVLRGHRRGVWSVKFAPASTPPLLGAARGLILTGSGDKTVKVWSLADYACLLTLEGHTGSVLKAIWLPPPVTSDGSTPSSETQVASAGGDGLVKIWALPSGALAATLDNHTDRVWCLASHGPSRHLISASSDSTLTLWADTTSATFSSAQRAATYAIESEQRLANLAAAGDHRAAIGLALSLDRPARLLALLTAAVDAGARSELGADKTSISGLAAVDDALASLGRAQVLRLLGRVRDWNTNARSAMVAQRVLGVLVRAYGAEWLAGLGRRQSEDETEGESSGKGTTVKEVVEALGSYTQRHYKRVEMLEEEAWVLEYTLAEMADGRVDDARGVGDVVAL